MIARRVLVCAMLLAGGPITADAQTLTPPRAIFTYSEDADTPHKRRRAAKDSVVLSLVADGAFRTIVSGGSRDSVSSPLTGSIGFMLATYNWHLLASIAPIGSDDTVRTRHAGSLLYPQGGRGGRNFLIDLRVLAMNKPGQFPWSKAGGHAYWGGSPLVWIVPNGQAADTVLGNTMSLGVAGQFEWLNFRLGPNDISFVTDLGYAWRSLGGEITSSSNRAVLTRAFGEDITSFAGPELGFTVQVNGVRAGVTYYYFGADVPGIAKREMAFGVAIGGPVIALRGAPKFIQTLF